MPDPDGFEIRELSISLTGPGGKPIPGTRQPLQPGTFTLPPSPLAEKVADLTEDVARRALEAGIPVGYAAAHLRLRGTGPEED